MVNLYEVGVVYKEGPDTHRENELLVFASDKDAEDYIRKGAIKALFTLVDIDKLGAISKKFWNKTAEEITSELIDQISNEEAVKVFDILKKLAVDPTVEKYYIEKVDYFEDPNGNKYSIEVKEPKPTKGSAKSK